MLAPVNILWWGPTGILLFVTCAVSPSCLALTGSHQWPQFTSSQWYQPSVAYLTALNKWLGRYSSMGPKYITLLMCPFPCSLSMLDGCAKHILNSTCAGAF